MDYVKEIEEYIKEEVKILETLNLKVVDEIISLIEKARLNNKKIYICGNGGSAATASHFCCDFNKGYSGGLKNNTNFICLSDNVPTLTAIANDISYDDIFSYQIRNRIEVGDILFVISGSGNSKNIVKAMEVAKERGNTIIGLCGYNGGQVLKMSDICLHVNINNMQIVEDVHMFLDHCMMFVLSKGLLK